MDLPTDSLPQSLTGCRIATRRVIHRRAKTTNAQVPESLRFGAMVVTACAAFFGLAAGAFVPRVAHRWAATACTACARPFPAGVTGWVRAGAACRCHPPPRLLPAGSALSGGLLGVALGPVVILPVLLLAAILAAVLAEIDMRFLRLPDPLVGALAVVVLLPLTLTNLSHVGRATAAAALVGLGYLILAMLAGGGLGLGDVKLAAVLSTALGFAGWSAVLIGVVVPHLINGSIALFLLLKRRAHRGTALPFGPALLFGALIALSATVEEVNAL